MTRTTTRFLIVLTFAIPALFGGAVFAGIPPSVSADAAGGGREQYIVVFRAPSANAKPFDDGEVTRAGGHVDYKVPGRIVVSLPPGAVEALRSNPAVKYLQRVAGGPQPVVYPSDSDGAAPSIMRIGSDAQKAHADTTPPLWNSGEHKYDDSGNIYAIGTAAIPSSDQRQNTYTYDALGRLTRATINTDLLSDVETYTYDPYGNLLEKKINSNDPEQIFTDPATNHIIGADYDAGGNLWKVGTDVYTFDPFNMLRQYNYSYNEDLYVYDVNDERIGTRTQGDTWTWSLRGFDGQVLRQYRSSESYPNMPWLWLEDYVYRDGMLLGAQRVAEEGGRRHFHLDHLGSPRLITGTNGVLVAQHDFRPFGLEASVLSQETAHGFDREDPMRFTGHERDFEEGTSYDNTNFIDYMHARYYRTAWERFLSVDPVEGMTNNPQSFNRYAYVRNSPIVTFDPTGRDGIVITAEGPPPCGDCDREAQEFSAESAQWRWLNYTEVNRVFASSMQKMSKAELQVVGFILSLPAGGGEGEVVIEAAIEEIAETAAEEDAAEGLAFDSFRAFKKWAGDAGTDFDWHHIVEQNPGNIKAFGKKAIQNSVNLFKVLKNVHRGKGSISAYYSSKQAFTAGLTVRQWLATKSYAEQFEFGMQVLKTFGVIK